MKFVTAFSDEERTIQYYLVAGDNEEDNWLYVNIASPSIPRTCEAMIHLGYIAPQLNFSDL